VENGVFTVLARRKNPTSAEGFGKRQAAGCGGSVGCCCWLYRVVQKTGPLYIFPNI